VGCSSTFNNPARTRKRPIKRLKGIFAIRKKIRHELDSGLPVGDLDFNLPQQRGDLLRLAPFHGHTSVPLE
jgi:hypothetical protein